MISADTNVFVYAFDPLHPLKQSMAKQVVSAFRLLGAAAVALQLVGELQSVLRRKLKMDAWLAAEAARSVLTNYRTFPASEASVGLALAQVATGRLSYWDALMLAAAREAGCTAMLTEDMQDGARLFGLEIVNPFGPSGLTSRAAELLHLQ